MDMIRNITDNINKALLFVLLFFVSFASVYITLKKGLILGLLVAAAPVLLIFLIALFHNPYWAFLTIFFLNYYISGISRYIPRISPGIVMDLFVIVAIVVLIFQSFKKESQYRVRDMFNPLTILTILWFVYCFLQIFNPSSSSAIAWITNVRGIGVYFLVITVLSSVFLRKYNQLRQLLYIWSVLALTAVIKAIMQKTMGFDFAEARWLAEGARSTHILYTGIRYFSFFTDAANFGSGMGFTCTVFLISSFYFKKPKEKLYFFIVAIGCGYGMIISGTRGSIVIPFLGLLYYTFLSKSLKAILISVTFLIISFGFLRYTYVGHSNQYIRRVRSVFNQEDESLVTRVDNQRTIKVLMKGQPLGIGIGMMRGKATTYRAHPVFSQIPHDSWYVLLWVELGIVGLILYLFILFYILLHGSYLVLFKLKNSELKGIITSILCGLLGLYAAAYSLEIFGQFPNAFIIYICMTFVFLSPLYDKELEEQKNLLNEPTV